MILDSPPVALPRPLKRSASTASLPTPPHTHRHKRSRRPTDSDDDSSVSVLSSSSTPPRHPPALLYGRRSRVGLAPVSPPPSHRKALSTTLSSTPLPVTPERKRNKGITTLPIRDSPNNPFILSSDDTQPIMNPSTSPDLSSHTQIQERPTVTYVFRGVRGTFPNPLYDHDRGRPRSPSARSKLPVEHPDFSPDPGCPPKVLFPAAPGAQRRSRRILERLPAGETLSGKVSGGAEIGSRKVKSEIGWGRGPHRMRSSRVSAPAVDDGEEDGDGDDEGDGLDVIKPIKLKFEATDI